MDSRLKRLQKELEAEVEYYNLLSNAFDDYREGRGPRKIYNSEGVEDELYDTDIRIRDLQEQIAKLEGKR